MLRRPPGESRSRWFHQRRGQRLTRAQRFADCLDAGIRTPARSWFTLDHTAEVFSQRCRIIADEVQP